MLRSHPLWWGDSRYHVPNRLLPRWASFFLYFNNLYQFLISLVTFITLISIRLEIFIFDGFLHLFMLLIYQAETSNLCLRFLVDSWVGFLVCLFEMPCLRKSTEIYGYFIFILYPRFKSKFDGIHQLNRPYSLFKLHTRQEDSLDSSNSKSLRLKEFVLNSFTFSKSNLRWIVIVLKFLRQAASTLKSLILLVLTENLEYYWLIFLNL